MSPLTSPKVSTSYVITLLNRTPVYGKAIKNGYQKAVSCYDKIGLYAQNISTIAGSIVQIVDER